MSMAGTSVPSVRVQRTVPARSPAMSGAWWSSTVNEPADARQGHGGGFTRVEVAFG